MPSFQRALVTGAGSPLGVEIVRSLLRSNLDPVPFLDQDASPEPLAKLGLDCWFGSPADLDTLLGASSGCDLIFLTDPYASARASRSDSAVAYTTTLRNVLLAARSAGGARVVFSGQPESPPGTPKGVRGALWWWTRSKRSFVSPAASEHEAHRLARAFAVDLVVISTEEGLTTSQQASAHLAVARSGQPGRRYLVARNEHQVDSVAEKQGLLPGCGSMDCAGTSWACCT